MTAAERPPKDAYLLNVLRRRDDVLWAGERQPDRLPTVIARDVEAVRSQLPPAAGEGWNWVDSRWSWADVRAASAQITRLGTRIRSVNVGPRDDDTFGITVELEGPDGAVAAYVATLEPGLVRIVESEGSDDPRVPAHPSAFQAAFPTAFPGAFPAAFEASASTPAFEACASTPADAPDPNPSDPPPDPGAGTG